MERYLGGFVSCAGGLYKILQRADSLNINTVMTHPAPPQRWNSQPFKDEVWQTFNKEKVNFPKIEKIYFHGIYLINLANPDKQKFHLSKVSVMHHLDLLRNINGDGVIFHTGSFKEITEEEGFERVIYGLNWIFDNVEELPSAQLNKDFWAKPRLFLEVAAGSGNVVGDQFEELARIYNGIKKEHQHKLGFCLDTQHMFASGYDLINDLNNVVDKIDNVLGLERIPVIHFNDSKTEFASHKDRHEDLGENGKIGIAAMKAFLNHPKLKGKDFILETPSLDDAEGSLQQIKMLKDWAE